MNRRPNGYCASKSFEYDGPRAPGASWCGASELPSGETQCADVTATRGMIMPAEQFEVLVSGTRNEANARHGCDELSASSRPSPLPQIWSIGSCEMLGRSSSC